MNKIDFTREGREVLSLESRALGQLADRLDAGFSRACELLLACEGRIIVVGIGCSCTVNMSCVCYFFFFFKQKTAYEISL